MKGIQHESVGNELTRNEWEGETSHFIASGVIFPENPTETDLFYRTDEHKLYIFDGTDWIWGGGGTPSGVITMWHSLIENIPKGWVICDGDNGTPDLRDKFVKGAPAATEAGATGGEASHTLTIDEMPSHTHTYSRRKAAAGTSYGSGTYTSETANTGATGGNSAHENRPPFYEVIFIMKL